MTMTCLRSFKTRQWSWLRTPLAGLILRDPLMVSLFLLGRLGCDRLGVFLLTVSSSPFVDRLHSRSHTSPFMECCICMVYLCTVNSGTYSPLISLWMSLTTTKGCRLILSMRKLVIRHNLIGQSGELQLTSIVRTDSADISFQ